MARIAGNGILEHLHRLVGLALFLENKGDVSDGIQEGGRTVRYLGVFGVSAVYIPFFFIGHSQIETYLVSARILLKHAVEDLDGFIILFQFKVEQPDLAHRFRAGKP